MKFKTLVFSSLVGLITLGVLGASACALSDDETRYRLQCMTTGLAPRVALTDGPVEIGTEWKYFAIPSEVKRLPFIDRFEIAGSHIHHRMTEDLPKLLPKDLGYRWGLVDMRTNKISWFSVKVIDDQGHEVRLTQNSWLFGTATNPPTSSPQFSLSHKGWGKYFFSPEAKLQQVAVRASHPIVVERLSWTLYGYCKWPNRTWDSIPESERYNFEGPSPATDELE